MWFMVEVQSEVGSSKVVVETPDIKVVLLINQPLVSLVCSFLARPYATNLSPEMDQDPGSRPSCSALLDGDV